MTEQTVTYTPKQREALEAMGKSLDEAAYAVTLEPDSPLTDEQTHELHAAIDAARELLRSFIVQQPA